MSLAMAPYILEFLSTLARLPHLYVNCTDTEFKRIFGIALQYIESSTYSTSMHASPTNITRPNNTNFIAQYILQLAYHVITVWFINMKITERRKYVPFIIHHILSHSNTDSDQQLNENIELVLDVLVQNTFSDCSASPWNPNNGSGTNRIGSSSSAQDTNASTSITEKVWLQGNSLISIRPALLDGWCEVFVRRPSGVVALSVRLENKSRLSNVNNSLNLPALSEYRANLSVNETKNVSKVNENNEGSLYVFYLIYCLLKND